MLTNTILASYAIVAGEFNDIEQKARSCFPYGFSQKGVQGREIVQKSLLGSGLGVNQA